MAGLPLLRADGHAVLRVSPTYEELSAFFRMVTGRVLAAYATPEELGEMVAVHGLPGESWNGIEAEEALMAALAEVRRAGMAEECHRTEVFPRGTVLDACDQLLGALGVHLPASGSERREDPARDRRGNKAAGTACLTVKGLTIIASLECETYRGRGRVTYAEQARPSGIARPHGTPEGEARWHSGISQERCGLSIPGSPVA